MAKSILYGRILFMKLKYNLNLSSEIIEKDIKRIINQVYKLVLFVLKLE